MSRVTNILNKARLILGDTAATRWSNADLLILLNEGLLNFITQTETLKLRSFVTIENYISLYDMSPYAISINRVDYLNSALATKSYEQMDKLDRTWIDTTGTIPKYVVFNKLKANQFKIYPKIASGMADIVTANSLYGGLIDITVDEVLFTSPVLNVAEADIPLYLLVYYIGKPRVVTIDTIDNEVDIDDMYDIAMSAYIAGQALSFDQDTLSRELSTTQLNIYNGYAAKAFTKEAENNNNFESYITEYRRF